jgi:hypothetical protein
VTRAAPFALALVCTAAGVAQAQPAGSVDGGAPSSAVSADEAEIARALEADQAAEKAKRPSAAAPAPGPSPATPSAGFGAALGRVIQSLNPDLAAIVDFAGGWFSDDSGTIKSGDDPQATGFNAQEIELTLSAVVDPYFRADIFLTIPDLAGIEVEEAFLTTTQLPGNLQLRAGVFRATLGRQNAQHLHLQDFTRRPAVNAQFLGVDGLRAPGLEINWLVPRIPFYLLLTASAFTVGGAETDQPLQSFGGGARWDFTYVASARAFFPLSEATSLYAGLNYARGKTSQKTSRNDVIPSAGEEGSTMYDNFFDNLYGVDLYLKWKPPNQVATYASVAWQSEFFLRQIPDLTIAGVRHPELEGGLYSQVVVQTHRRWYLGLRGELMGIPSGDNVKREYAGAASVTWGLSEFSRVRLYGEVRYGPRFVPTEITAAGPRVSGAAFLQLEASIGAHGAHPF